jgi:microcompartment protein CcmL/EutN
MPSHPALLLIELESVAVGTEMADAMIKRAPVDTFRAGTVQPGKFLILVGGSVAAVEEALTAADMRRGTETVDQLFLPEVHPDVYESVGGKRRKNRGVALGVIETASVAAVIRAADRALKTANVQLIEMRLGDGLGGKGIALVSGNLDEVQAAIEAGVAAASRAGDATRSVVIPSQHEDLRKHLEESTQFY